MVSTVIELLYGEFAVTLKMPKESVKRYVEEKVKNMGDMVI